MNLLTNALKFTVKGSITVTAKVELRNSLNEPIVQHNHEVEERGGLLGR